MKKSSTTKTINFDITPYEETYVYQEGPTRIAIKIDYYRETISIVDGKSPNQGKRFLFKDRTLDYMQGWQQILDTMKHAIAHAENKLREHIKSQPTLEEAPF